MSKQLLLINISEELYDKLLNSFPSQLVYCHNIYETFYGTKDKNKLYFNEEYIVIKLCKFNYIYKLLYGYEYTNCETDWKQVKLRLDRTVKTAEHIPNGHQCYLYITGLLKKFYTEEEIDNILLSHTEPYNEEYKQYHYTYNSILDDVIKFTDCYKYDITKAHASAIINLFPKAKNVIMNLLKKSALAKKNKDYETANRYKAYVNYYVGYLNHKNSDGIAKYEGTYNYIVQNVTKKIFKALKYTGGQLLYANTDSFTVSKPNNTLTPSTEIGEFKLEYSGDIYIYQDSNYWLMEFGEEKVGSCKIIARKNISLKDGIVAHYKAKRIYICTDNFGKKHYRTEVEEICTEKVNVVEL